MRYASQPVGLLASASVLAFICAGSAAAQTTDASRSAAEVTELVVTAQKRAENVQDVPMSVAAISAQDLGARGGASVTDLQTLVPGLQLNRSLRASTPYIRGVGSPSAAPGEEGSSAVYIDGVYLNNLNANVFTFNNVARVEVLKGPQGTLFGRNSLGGMIQVITREPSETPEADMSVSLANYQTVEAKLYVTGPIVPNVTADFAFIKRTQFDGYGMNITTGKDIFDGDEYGMRTKWVWRAGEDTRVTLLGDYTAAKDTSGASGFRGPQKSSNGFSALSDFYDIQQNFEPFQKHVNGGVALKVEHELGPVRVQNLTAVRGLKSFLRIEGDNSPQDQIEIDNTVRERAVTNEFQLQSAADSEIQWVGGLYYLFDHWQVRPFKTRGTIFGAASNFTDRYTFMTLNSYAGFAQATAPVPGLADTRMTGGIRRTSDRRSLGSYQRSNIPAQNLAARGDHVTYKSTTYHASLDHDFAEDVMGYVSYSTGFKGGIYNLSGNFTDGAVEPQTAKQFEVGLKSTLLDSRLLLNVALFHTDQKGLQLRRRAPAGNVQLLNAAAGVSKGIDVDFQAVPTASLKIQGGFEVLRAKYTDFRNAPVYLANPTAGAGANPIPTGWSCIGPTASPNGYTECMADMSGTPMIQSPRFTGNLGAIYTIETHNGSLDLGLNYNYTGRQYFSFGRIAPQKAYSLVSGQVAWTAPGDRWTVTLWGKNLTDTQYHYALGIAARGLTGNPAPPRTFGVTLSGRFGG